MKTKSDEIREEIIRGLVDSATPYEYKSVKKHYNDLLDSYALAIKKEVLAELRQDLPTTLYYQNNEGEFVEWTAIVLFELEVKESDE